MKTFISIALLLAFVSITASASGQVLRSAAIPFTPLDVAFDPETRRVFVPNEPGDGKCMVFSEDLSFLFDFTMPFGPLAKVTGIAVEPDTDLIWSVTIAGQANIIETTANGVFIVTRGVIPVISGNSILGIDLDETGNTLFVNLSGATASIPMASLGTLSTATVCPVPTPGDQRFGVAWRSNTSVLALGLDPVGTVDKIDALDLTGCILGTTRTLPINFSLGIDVGLDDLNGLELYVSDLFNSTVNRVRIERAFIRGDINGDLAVTQGDLLLLLQFLGGAIPTLPCMSAADFNDNSLLEPGDILGLSLFLNSTGAPPPPLPPFPACGLDPTPDALTCAFSTCP